MAETVPTAGTSKSRSVLFWIVVAVVVGSLYTYMESRGPDLSRQGANHAAVGRPLPVPGLELEALSAGTDNVALSSLRGNVVLLNFWGVWCGYCRQEMPHLAKLQKQFGGRDDFRLLTVSCPIPGDDSSLAELRSSTEEYMKRHGFSLPVYADPSESVRHALTMVSGMDGFGYPTTVLFGRDGRIRASWIGFRPGFEDDMQKQIERALSEIEPPTKGGTGG